MNTELSPRRGVTERITGALWGAIVAAVGGFAIAALSGYTVDLELFAIVALGVLGVWLLFSAIAAGRRATRRERERAEAVAGPAPVMQDDAAAEPAPTAPEAAEAVDPEPELADTQVLETQDTEVLDTTPAEEPKRES